MAEIIILGTAAAVPAANQDYAHLAVETDNSLVLVDCGSSPMVRLSQMGLDWRKLDDVVTTHFHADHVASLPNLIVGMWLSGREHPLRIHGLESTLDKIKQLMALFEWKDWPGLYPISFHPVPDTDTHPFIETEDLQIFAARTKHSVPSIGLKFHAKESGQDAVYSGDTKPCNNIARLAKGAAVLVHEATGDQPGHSSPSDAGDIAQQAQVSALILIHYMAGAESSPEKMIATARKMFAGQVTLAFDGMRIRF